MVLFVKIDKFVDDLAKKVHNLGTDVMKVCLTNTLPVAATATVLANISQIAATGGYTSGGATITTTSATTTGGIFKLVLADPTPFTATAAGMPTFQWVVLYNSTAASGPLIGFWDYGSGVTLANTETFTVDFDPSTGVLTIQ